jgi:hypothetical protein
MPNIVSKGGTDEDDVKCIILCCDKKKYKMETKPMGKGTGYGWKWKNCWRLGSMKHACVTKNVERLKNDQIVANKRFKKQAITNKKVRAYMTREGRETLVPDVCLLESEHAIDAKFPCNERELTKKMGKKGLNGFSRSPARPGIKSEKEEMYAKLPGMSTSEAMSPDDAKQQLGKKKCNCRKVVPAD